MDNAAPTTGSLFQTVTKAPSNSLYNARMIRALLALGLGGFAIGTGEFVIMGLLPEVAHDLGVSIPQAGDLISSYALGVMLGAPVLAVMAAGWPRRRLLTSLGVFYALTTVAIVLMPGFWSIAIARFASGFPHGPFFGVAALVAATMAPSKRRGQAIGFVLLGLTLAILAGAPLATWIGQLYGWRVAYLCVGLCALLAAVLIHVWVPEMSGDTDARPMRQLGALARPQVWFTLAIAGIGFGGMFCVFSYIKPTLINVTGLDVTYVPAMMALFGLGAVIGNLIGARMADRALTKTIAGTLLYATVLLLIFGTLMAWLPTAAIGIFLLGGVGAMTPAMQLRLMNVAGDAQTLAAALNHSAFNFANAMGAWLGGALVAAGIGWRLLGTFGAVLPVCGLAILVSALLHQKRAISQ